MMPQEWPIAALAADRNAPARLAGRNRLATVRADFFLDPGGRLTEQERALMTAMLHCLVGDIADELRAALPAARSPANDDDNAAIVEALTRTRLLDDAALMALLLRRADEERFATAVRARGGRRDARLIQGLVSNRDGAISAAAMALILARGRRRDRFGQCLVATEDLTAASADRLVHAIAAALRREVAAPEASAAADADLGAAAERLLGSCEPSRSLDHLTADLVRALDDAGALTDDLLVAAAQEGEAGFLASALGRRSTVAPELAMDELQSGSAARVAALLRLGGLSREFCAGLIASVGDLLGIADPGDAMNVFDTMPQEKVNAARVRLTASPAYRTALEVLESGNG